MIEKKAQKIPSVVQSEFYNSHDIVQRRYEMLRFHEVEGVKVKIAAKVFSYSVAMYEHLRQRFDKEGIIGLLPKKYGPKKKWKVTDEVMKLIISNREKGMNIVENAQRLKEQGYSVHPSTIDRALQDLGYPRKRKSKKNFKNKKSTKKI